jgi:hypothetical protein
MGSTSPEVSIVEYENTVEWKMRTKVLLCWAITVAVTAFLGFIGYPLLPELSPRPALGTLITSGGLAVIGAGVVAGLLAWAVGATRAARRYGDATFELASVPVPLGGRLEGRIRADATLAPDQALNLVLRCEAGDRGGGESGGGSWVVWESEQLATAADCEQQGGELIVPIDLPVPGDQPPTGKDRRNEYSWHLDMSLEPRSGYAPRFPFTVLRTAESPPEPEKEPEPAIGIVGVLDKVGEFAALAKDGAWLPQPQPGTRIRRWTVRPTPGSRCCRGRQGASRSCGPGPEPLWCSPSGSLSLCRCGFSCRPGDSGS